MSEIDQVVENLGKHYADWKESGKEKERYRKEFFKLADKAIENQGVALRLETFPGESIEAAEERCKLHNPGWLVDERRPHRLDAGHYDFVLKEDPSFKAYSYEHNGVKYSRSVSRGAVMVDDQWILEEVPELYDRVTYELPWGARIAIPIDYLPDTLIGKLSKYIYNDKPKVSLQAPREVKDV